MGVRCDVGQVAIYFPRHGRAGAPGMVMESAEGSALWHGQGSCVEHPCASSPSWAVLWSLVPGTRGTCQDMSLLGTVPVVCMFPST